MGFVIYVVNDEVLRILRSIDDPQAQISDAEIITFTLITAKYFKCNKFKSTYGIRFFTKGLLFYSSA